MKVVEYTPDLEQDLQKLCVQIAAPSDEAGKKYLLVMYCNAYLQEKNALVLETEDGTPAGYVFWSAPWPEHAAVLRPYLAGIDALGGIYPYMAKAELQVYKEYAPEYPVHLHIDLLEAYTGGGNGTRLMQTLLARLCAEDAKGVMLQVSTENKRAVAFYRKNGFAVLQETPHYLVMGQKIRPGTL